MPKEDLLSQEVRQQRRALTLENPRESVRTCLALLILKKADLATDLSDRLSDNSNELTKVVEQRLNLKPEKPPETPPASPPQQAGTEVTQSPPDPSFFGVTGRPFET